MSRRPSLSAPFGERSRPGRPQDTLISRGLVVESGVQHRARQAVRAAEQLSRVVVEGLEEGVVITDADLRAVNWNASATTILGRGDDELNGAAAPFAPEGALTDADGVAVTEEHNFLRRAAGAEGPVRDVLRRRPKDGKGDRWITVLARPIAALPGGEGGFVCTFEDVTQTVLAERQLREERDRAQRYLEVASTLVVVLDQFGRVELINQQGCDLLGFEAEELIGEDWFSTVVPDPTRLDARLAFTRLVSGVEPPAETVETVVQTRAGNDRVIAWRNAVLTDPEGQIVSVLRSGEDVTERREAEAQVAFMAYHDPLTGLPNRTMLEEQLGRELARARREGRQLALLYLDLDDFKLVNDSLGHSAGDLVLSETAKRVSELVRAGDLVCRQGGDEFLLLLSCEGDDAAAVAVDTGERIAAALQRPFSLLGADFHLGVSVGAAVFPTHGQDAESLFKRADSAMYQAKRMGGASVALYEPEASDSRRRLSLTTQLRTAVAQDQLRLHFQPIFHSRERTISSLEALVRWEHPDHGLVPPNQFIPIAEQTGLIDEIGEWVVGELCRQAAVWAAAGRRPMLTFNVSPRQLRRPDLAQTIVGRIAAGDLPPGQFCAELTETSVLDDARRQRSLLEELHEAGLSIAIDDFGSGHSSLARLRDLPVGVLKVDRSFVSPVPGDPRAAALVAAMLDIGRALGVTTVVEGIETEEQLSFMIAHGCPLAQGFLLARPVPADQIPVASLPRSSRFDPEPLEAAA